MPSDVDVVVGLPPEEVLMSMHPLLQDIDLHPVVIWRYDVAGTLTVFLATGDASDGLQLDLLFDPLGSGKYGIKSEAILTRSLKGERWPKPHPIDEQVYLLRKRHTKGQSDRVRELAASMGREDPLSVERALQAVVAPRGWRETQELLAGGAPSSPSSKEAERIPELRRRVRRVFEPAGAWVHLEGAHEESALFLADRLSRFLPKVGVAEPPFSPLVRFTWSVRHVAPVRWRPGVFVSFGPSLRLPPIGPDVTVLEGEDPARPTVAGLRRLAMTRLGVGQ